MGIEVHCKSYFPGSLSMRDLNEDANSSSWPMYYGDKTSGNGQYCNGFMQRTVTDTYPRYDKDALKQKMLEHEAIFKNQVYELHRVYRIQRNMMEEIKKEQHKHRISIEKSGSSFLVSQMPSEDARKWHVPNVPLANTGYARSSRLDADIIDSPLSCAKVNSTQAGRLSSQNGSISKDCEVLESRPSKVRKKLFDLQLPADEYIDTEEMEQFQNNKISDMSSTLNRNHEISHGNNVKLFLVGGGRTDYRRDASTSDSCLRSSIRMADLNEPVQVEEATGPTSVDFLGRSACHGEVRGLDLSAKPKSEFLGLPNEIERNSYPGSSNRTLNNLSVENIGNGRGWSSNSYGADHNKSNLACIPQGLQQEKFILPSHPMQVMLNKARQLPGIFPTDHNREDQCRDGATRSIEISDRNRDPSKYNCLDSVVASQTPNAYPFANSTDLVNPWSQSVSSWGKPISSLTQKLTSAHTDSYLNSSTLSRSSQPSSQGHDVCGDKWHVNGNYRPNPGLRGDLPTQNGCYHGSSSGSKEQPVYFPSFGFDYQNCNRNNNLASQRPINHGSEKFCNGSNFMELKSAKAMNLNVALSSVSSNEAVSQHDLMIVDENKKCEDHLAVLPWLRARPACKNDATDTRRDSSLFQASSNPLLCQSETMTDLNQVFSENGISALSDHDIEAKKEMGESLSKKKILGFPIFGYPCASKNDSSSLLSTSESRCCPPNGELIENNWKNRGIDINLACDPSLTETGDHHIAVVAVVAEKSMDTKLTGVRNHIDLNSCISEDEDLLAPSVANTGTNVKIAVEIELEVPLVPEIVEEILPLEQQKQYPEALQSPEHKGEQPQDEVVKIAAEAIVSISSSSQRNHKVDTICHPLEASLAVSLLWFVEVVSSCGDDIEKKFGKETRDKGGGDIEDSFEAMTLQLTETKEEDYMPKPFAPEIQDSEETGATSLSNRPRRGQKRRGRQRRDFQKDILPGLASLSRHEVTEDLQTFGGLMRATGHPWNTGLSRRNGTRNGAAWRRRQSVVDTVPSVMANPVHTPLIQQLNNIDAGLEDRILTGWGKTPRRPRRQRCPAGNPHPVPLT